jgi:hypothetical protein
VPANGKAVRTNAERVDMVTGGLVVLAAWLIFGALVAALLAVVLHDGKKE